jgi:ParB/RepB/Spo0J family partition protein
MKSFKQLVQAGEIKRADAMKIALDDIHEEPGFNLRTEGDDLEASIDALADYIHGGGIVPALEVRPREEGGVWVIDGHRRRRAFIKARDRGAPIEWVNIVAFVGNDADRVARIITSQEGRKLDPLEIGLGYKRLQAFGKTNTEIASMVKKTPQHVDQMLVLANANSDVHAMVKRGEVTAGVAVGLVRKHGEDAGSHIADALTMAKANGKKKVTAGVVAGPKLPKKETESVVDELDAFIETISTEERIALAGIEAGTTRTDTIMVSGRALLALMNEYAALKDAQAKQAERQREKANKAAQQELPA